MGRGISFALICAAGLVGGCGSSTSLFPDGGVISDAGMLPDGAKEAAGFGTIFTIVMENHDYNEVVGNLTDAPYINGLIARYGLATNYFDSGTHPSLPNYLYMVSGDTQYPGVIDVDPTTTIPGFCDFPVAADNLGGQLTASGVAWRAYMESMGTPCNLNGNDGYAPKHAPFLYFKNIQNGPDGLCAKTNVDYSQFAADLASGQFRYMWITPNLTDDGHDPGDNPPQGLKQSDAWLQANLPAILDSAAYRNNGVVFITWDEAEGRSGNGGDQVPMIVISPRLVSPGFKSAQHFNHANFLATVEDIFGLPRLGAAANGDGQSANMFVFFGPPVTVPTTPAGLVTGVPAGVGATPAR